MEEEIIIPTVPEGVEDSSTTITIHEEQWSLLLEDLELQQQYNQDSLEQITILNENITSLNDMVSSSNATSITYEQAETIINSLNNFETAGKYVIGAVLGWWVIKQLYNFISGTLFGGL